MKNTPRYFLFLPFIFLTIFIGGCGGYNIKHTSLSNAEKLTPSKKVTSVYFLGDPKPERSYKRIARIDISKTITAGSYNEALDAIKVYAGKIGADALIETDIYVAPWGTVCSGCVTGHATAIKWDAR